MPCNERETHPFLQIGENIPGSKMIIGTFPIYALTNPRTPRKDQLQLERNDISFFYGSRSNWFWDWYRQYIDPQINIHQPATIIASMQQHQIGISDVVRQCFRREESFNDNDLRDKHWNNALANTIEGNILKIICTSKSDSGAMGWLRDKILLPAGFTIIQAESIHLHQQILGVIPQSNMQLIPVAQVLVKGIKRVSIVALPSPGSPQRRLADFGYVTSTHTTTNYLHAYLSQTFNWFME
jgi:hypothetical protein